ncbi:MAG: hypothetical protein L6Q98_04175 [Anaerolineae bacterium]|nr:hypothetical protein [Anaerolineae bacterium]NUQ03823.1 hypothetical protein [Anaerolineae bacterium]
MTEQGLTHEVPLPGSVFWEIVEHPKNLELLEGDANVRRLSPKQLREMQSQLWLYQHALNVYRQAQIDQLMYQIASMRQGMKALTPEARSEAQETIDAIKARIDQKRAKIVKVKRPRSPIAVRNAAEAREAQSVLHRLKARAEEHRQALENETINKRLQDEMQSEIAYYGRQIVDRWTALGYREEVTRKGKTKLRRVKIAKAHFTEDNIQFKILVSTLSLLGSTRHHLPYNVRGWDLVRTETLRELEAACECPVTSPHTGDSEQGFELGIWVIVHRVGMRDGLFDYIELNTVLAKYNQALRKQFAVPVGVKAGRIIEYLPLTTTPHVMFNGITGSGKTNVARVMLTTWCRFYSPDEIKFVLIDLKRGGDLNAFADIPHTMGPIVRTIEELAALLPRLVAEMYRRGDLFSAAMVQDIEQFNASVAPEARLARIAVFVDEAGTIRDSAFGKEHRETIWRSMSLIAMQARSAGIHLVLGSQQPSKEALPTSITNNVTYTIMGRQRTTSGAMMSMGNNRLKDLPAIRGRMWLDNGFDLLLVQTPFATPQDIEQSVQIAKDYPSPRPFDLPHLDDELTPEAALDVVVPPKLSVSREQIIDLALSERDGVMNAQAIYDATKKITPRGQIMKMIKALADEGHFEYDGQIYDVVHYGKGYKIVKVETRLVSVSSNGHSAGVESALPDGIEV